MKYGKLRIAWSVACGILCLLLIVLWVRSYWCVHSVTLLRPNAPNLHAGVERGIIGLLALEIGLPQSQPDYQPIDALRFDVNYFGVNYPDFRQQFPGVMGFHMGPVVGVGVGMLLPAWFAVFVLALCAAFPWLRWRYSLRTLLIGMTLVAALLGAVIVALRGS